MTHPSHMDRPSLMDLACVPLWLSLSATNQPLGFFLTCHQPEGPSHAMPNFLTQLDSAQPSPRSSLVDLPDPSLHNLSDLTWITHLVLRPSLAILPPSQPISRLLPGPTLPTLHPKTPCTPQSTFPSSKIYPHTTGLDQEAHPICQPRLQST